MIKIIVLNKDNTVKETHTATNERQAYKTRKQLMKKNYWLAYMGQNKNNEQVLRYQA